MIKADKGYTLLDGKNIDLMQEFTHIVGDLLDVSPEIVIATFSAYNFELSQKVVNCNPNFLKTAERIIKDIKESRKDEKH